METYSCKQCTHFSQHYIIDSRRCAPINCGHCRYPRLKHKTPDSPACAHFSPRDTPADLPNRAEVIDFLTKDMLEYILSLELPPFIAAKGEEVD